jgi:hypothetical protein
MAVTAFDSRFQQLPASATFSSVVLTSFITSSATSSIKTFSVGVDSIVSVY